MKLLEVSREYLLCRHNSKTSSDTNWLGEGNQCPVMTSTAVMIFVESSLSIDINGCEAYVTRLPQIRGTAQLHIWGYNHHETPTRRTHDKKHTKHKELVALHYDYNGHTPIILQMSNNEPWRNARSSTSAAAAGRVPALSRNRQRFLTDKLPQNIKTYLHAKYWHAV